MRNSDKCIIKTIVLLIVGVVCIWYLSTDEGLELLNSYPISTLSVLSIIFLYVGKNHGAARGWHDIELRRSNPEWFKNEKLEDD